MLHEKRQEKKIELGNLVADREQLTYTLMNLFSFFFFFKKKTTVLVKYGETVALLHPGHLQIHIYNQQIK
jgi:hypothetical protein